MPKNTPEQLREVVINVFQTRDIVLAFSTGTPGPFRKITAMIMDSGRNVLGFAKIGETQLAIQRIEHEAKILKLIAHSSSFIAQQPSAITHQLSAISYQLSVSHPVYTKERLTMRI